MGGGGETKEVLKTIAKFKNDLYKTACGNARKLLKEKAGEDLPDTADLDDIMYPLALFRFKDEFGFTFEKDPLVYNSKDIPDALPGTITPIFQLCSITEGSDISGFVDAVFLSKAGFPVWMSVNAKGALKTLALQLTSQDTQLQCRFDGYQQSFDGDKEGEDSWRVKAVLVYLKGSLLQDDISVDITIVYFLAIYYKAISPTKAARDLIRAGAFGKAKAYASSNAEIDGISDLQNVLQPSAEIRFQQAFQFGFQDTSAPGLDPKASSPLNTRNSQLFYFQDLLTQDLKESVRERLFNGVNISKKYPFKGKILEDIITHLKLVLKDPTSGAWVDTAINQTYQTHNPILNTVRMNAVVVYFYDNKVVDNGVQVANTYILCLCRIWEIVSPENIIDNDIFKMMVNQLPQNQGQGLSRTESLTEWEDILSNFAKGQFEKQFRYAWVGDLSKPDDMIPGGKVRSFEAIAAFRKYPVEEREITDFIDAHFFERSSPTFPRYAMAHIYDDLKNDLTYRMRDFPGPNMWNTDSQDRIYETPYSQATFAGQCINVSTSYVYELGRFSIQSSFIQIPLVHVLMVVRTTKEGSLVHGPSGWGSASHFS